MYGILVIIFLIEFGTFILICTYLLIIHYKIYHNVYVKYKHLYIKTCNIHEMHHKKELIKIPDKTILKQLICHRIPERTFKIGERYFPVCSRCTGLYMGAFSYFAFVYMVYIQYTLEIILIAITMIIPTFIDGLTQFTGNRESNNALRFSTGLIAGIGLGILIKALKWILLG